jgi:hypothetical protein
MQFASTYGDVSVIPTRYFTTPLKARTCTGRHVAEWALLCLSCAWRFVLCSCLTRSSMHA